MYTERNFQTKKELEAAFRAGTEIHVFQPGGLFPGKKDGRVCIEGPHYPKPHSFYLDVEIKDSKIIKIYS